MEDNEKKALESNEDYVKYAKSIFGCAEEYYFILQSVIPSELVLRSTMAVTTNTAFACELYLKCILVVKNKEIAKGHYLDELYNKINNTEIKRRIEYVVDENNFLLSLKEVRKAFEVARYVHEYKQMSCNIGFLVRLMNALRGECINILEEKNV